MPIYIAVSEGYLSLIKCFLDVDMDTETEVRGNDGNIVCLHLR